MRILNLPGYALVAGAVVAILAGCSATGSPSGNVMPAVGGSAAAPGAVPASVKADRTAPLAKHAPAHDIFVADYGATTVKEIPKACDYASCVVTVGSGFSCPSALSLDSAQNVYVSNTCDYGTAVYKMPPGCNNVSCSSTMPGDYRNPLGTATDKHGNFYVANYSMGLLDEVPAGCNSSSCVVQLGGNAFCGLGCSYYWDYGPTDVAVDKHGNVYVSSLYGVSKMPPNCYSTSCVTNLGGGWNSPWGVSLDRHGNVYVNDRGNQEIKEMSAGCKSASCVKLIMSGFSDPIWAKADASGNVYVSDDVKDSIQEIPKGCRQSSCMVTIGGGFKQPEGLAVGP